MRPTVSVIVPFAGDVAEAGEAYAALLRLDRREGDELLIVDNSLAGVLGAEPAPQGIVVVRAAGEASAYHARNAGAERASGEWLLFVDADCDPPADLLDRFFAPAPAGRVGALAGEIAAAPGPATPATRYGEARALLGQAAALAHPYRPAAVTANLLVRRAAWEGVGGFHEGVRSGEDWGFCWRLQEAGWALELRAGAVVRHRHRDRVGELVRQRARDAAGRAWLERRNPGAFTTRGRVRDGARSAAAALRWGIAGQRERASLRALDALLLGVDAVGEWRSNAPAESRHRANPAPDPARPAAVLVDQFPEVSETFVVAELRALGQLGAPVRVEAMRRARHPDRVAAAQIEVAYAEDDARAAQLAALARLVGRHPLRCAADLLARRRWRREEPVAPLRAIAPIARRLRRGGETHLHAHFAWGAALTALRLARLEGVTYSVTPHGHDIFASPVNLAEKLRGAAFVTSGSDYTVAHLREVAGPGHAERVHRIVMGVDAERFRRRAPPEGGSVLAVGRLVEKKGFATLIEAAALLEREGLAVPVVIVGGGPLREELERLAAAAGAHGVRLAGPRGHEGVRELLEEAAVVAVPCVIAADGDRDSMPVIAKEALAMEVPVVASDVVGLPEVVRAPWGRLVAPGDAAALAAALAAVLRLPAEQRAAMGRSGREHVIAHADARRETAKLLELLRAAADPA